MLHLFKSVIQSWGVKYKSKTRDRLLQIKQHALEQISIAWASYENESYLTL